jgi:iron-sulfur cluster repair protein YtfE (RIC family)
MDDSTAEVDAVLSELKADIEHHVQEEESEAFPQFRAAVDQQTLQTLAEQVQEAKAAMSS